MKKKFLIGTLNCQNNKYNRGCKFAKGVNSAEILTNHLKEFNYDFFGTQEITKPFLDRIESYLDDYKSYGSYRFTEKSIFNNIFGIKKYNENNNIFTKNEVKDCNTIHLPWMPTTLLDMFCSYKKGFFIPRIATIIITKDNLCIVNTHLEYRVTNIQRKQLLYIESLVANYINRYPVVLMGDFNSNLSSELFISFIKNLSNLGLKRVDMDLSTHKCSKKAIDHIFVPSNWEVLESGLISDLDSKINKITDHKGVYARVKRK